jgi:hypothetical protein
MENNRYRLKEDKILGKIKVASKGDIVTVVCMHEGADGMFCKVSREKDDNLFIVSTKQLQPII